MEHDDIDLMLSKRAVPPKARADLSERIIHAAVAGIQEKPRKYSTLWSDLMGMLVVPHPSVVVATAIILGLAVGIQAGDDLFSLQQDWSSFLDINEGGWL